MPRILIADDDELLCELVSFKLEAAGHDVEVVSNGLAALEALRHETPDVLILDSMMPVMSGPEVLQAVKADAAMSSMPVIMLTARKGQEDVVSALRAGAADYLTKPFMPDELVMRVTAVLANVDRGTGNAASR